MYVIIAKCIFDNDCVQYIESVWSSLEDARTFVINNTINWKTFDIIPIPIPLPHIDTNSVYLFWSIDQSSNITISTTSYNIGDIKSYIYDTGLDIIEYTCSGSSICMDGSGGGCDAIQSDEPIITTDFTFDKLDFIAEYTKYGECRMISTDDTRTYYLKKMQVKHFV